MNHTQSVLKKVKNSYLKNSGGKPSSEAKSPRKKNVQFESQYAKSLTRERAINLETNLKTTILDRLDGKEQFLNNANINDLMYSLKESKMSIENELEDLHAIKKAMAEMNY